MIATITHTMPSAPLSRRLSAPSPATYVVASVTPPTPTRDDAATPRNFPRRVRGARPSLCPPELSTPIPSTSQHVFPSKTSSSSASQPLLYSPGISLRLGGLSATTPKQRGVSDSRLPSPPSSAPAALPPVSTSIPTIDDTPAVRKKCGQLLKSSLKSSRSSSSASSSCGSLSVFTRHIASKSEPTTPTPKAVHFDAQLEHVKLFLAEQKPLAVSRDGSPTDDTSGTDSDFPRFIFGSSSAPTPTATDKPHLQMQMHLTNAPPCPPAHADTRMVALESLRLAPDAASVLGAVRVRNIAYAKAVWARFTFDGWMTTSEVAGRWVEGVPCGGPHTAKNADGRSSSDWDRFAFTIRLHDIAPAEARATLVLAVKYVVDGKEGEAMWDNNGGANYVAAFRRVPPAAASAVSQREQSAPRRERRTRVPLDRDAGEAQDSDAETATEGRKEKATEEARDMADLRSKLEKVVADASSSSSSSSSNSNPLSASSSASSSTVVASSSSSSAFGARYDFARSLRSGGGSAWDADAHSPAPYHAHAHQYTHHRAQSFPMASSSSSVSSNMSASPYAQSMGSPRSPREAGEGWHLPRRVHAHAQGQTQGQGQKGYFDLPLPASVGGRHNSFPPTSPSALGPGTGMSAGPGRAGAPTARGVGLALPLTDSALSTPGMVSPATSSEEDDVDGDAEDLDAELEEAEEAEVAALVGMGVGVYAGVEKSPDTSYRQFLNKFCFFTGPGSEHNPSHAHGVSGLSRSSSLDDLALRSSGSVTPTLGMGGLGMGGATPTLGSVRVVARS